MNINVHMIVTKTFIQCNENEVNYFKGEVEKWLNEVNALSSNLDKIGTFIYSNGEAVDDEYKNVRFIVEIENEKQQ